MAKAVYEFAIKKDILNSGKVIHTPVCRKKSKFGRFIPNPWERITKIYDEFTLMELNFTPKLTQEDCEQHIAGYQQVLKQSVENNVAIIEFHSLEKKEI